MKAFDNNSDKKINMKEWLDGFENYKDPPRVVAPTTVLNTEGDRRASAFAARKLYEEIMKKNVTVDRMFYVLDADHNGFLDK